MAIFSVQVKSLSRGKGDSATAAAAYRAGLRLDDPSGARHDYSKKIGVLSVDMIAPDGVPAWAIDPHQLWGKVEEHETRKNARVAREVLVALPHELDPEQRRDLARNIGQLLVERYGVAAQVALHAPDRGGDNRNFHTHILITPRQVGPDGFGNSAAKVLDEFKAGAQELKDLRAAIGARINLALAAAGASARVDHRRLMDRKAEAAERGDFGAVAQLDRLPTKHEGKAVTQARRRGERLPRAKRNDALKTAGERRFNRHTRRFEDLKAKAAAEGRLQPVDEQALHARALMERRRDGARRLEAAAGAEVHAIDQSLARRAAVQARAKRPASHKAGPSMPRQAAGAARHPGKVSAAVERAARSKDRTQVETVVMQEAAKQLEALIEEMLTRARKALQQPEGLSPWQRDTARRVLSTHTDSQERKAAFYLAKEQRDEAIRRCRRAEADANHFRPGDDLSSRLARFVGRPNRQDQKAERAAERHREARQKYQDSRRVRDVAKKSWEEAVQNEEKARSQFADAFGMEVPRLDAKLNTQPAPAADHVPPPAPREAPKARRPGPR